MLAITNASPEGLNFSTSTTVVRLRRIFSGLGLEEDLGKQMFKYRQRNHKCHNHGDKPESRQRIDVDNTTGASRCQIVRGESKPSCAQAAVVSEFVQGGERPQIPHVNLVELSRDM